MTKESKETRTDRVWDRIANYFGYSPIEERDKLLEHLIEGTQLLAEGEAIIAQQEHAHQLVMQFFTQMGIKSFSVDPETRVVNHVDFDENIVVNQSLVKALLDFGIEVSIPMQENKDPLAPETPKTTVAEALEATQGANGELLDTSEQPEIPTVTPDLSTEPEQTDFSYLSNHPKGFA